MFGFVLFLIVYVILVHLFAPAPTPRTAPVTSQVDAATLAPIFEPVPAREKPAAPVKPKKQPKPQPVAKAFKTAKKTEDMTIRELKKLASQLKIKGYSNLRKAELKMKVDSALN